MKADAREVRALFEREQCLVVPVFQRPYVWNRVRNWEPLWADITSVAETLVDDPEAPPHFLGAVVLDGTEKSAEDISVWQIVDGQQRLTTLQVVLSAIRDALGTAGAPPKYVKALRRLTLNEDNLSDAEFAEYKVWPTLRDRAPFRAIVQGAAADYSDESRLVDAYGFFREAALQWLAEIEMDTGHIDALVKTMRSGLQLVAIELTEDDNAQVIFESLNDRGTPLLPSDLVKNSLFQQLEEQGADVEELWEAYWQRLETPFWQEEVRQGRLIRSRLDAFFSHYLTMRTGSEVLASSLFTKFKELTRGMSCDGLIELTHEVAASADRYRAIVAPSTAHDHSRLMTVAESLDTTVLAPVVLYLDAHGAPGDRAEAYDYIESWLVRRALLRSTSKNYNRMLLDLLQALRETDGLYAPRVREFFLSNESESGRWPTDDEVHRVLTATPVYKNLTRARIRLVLRGCEQVLRRGTGIDSALDGFDVALLVDGGDGLADALRASIGNLTLVHSPRPRKLATTTDWYDRRSMLVAPDLMLSRDLPATPSDIAITSRGARLAEAFCAHWPHPAGSPVPMTTVQTQSPDVARVAQSPALTPTPPPARAPSPAERVVHEYFSTLPVGSIVRLDSLFSTSTDSGKAAASLRESLPPEYEFVKANGDVFISKRKASTYTVLQPPAPGVTSQPNVTPTRTRTTYDGKVTDLLRAGLLRANDELFHEQAQKGLVHKARVCADGTINIGARRYTSPSAALSEATGTSRNGWKDWYLRRTGESLDDLRAQLDFNK